MNVVGLAAKNAKEESAPELLDLSSQDQLRVVHVLAVSLSRLGWSSAG
jgi:hypothetical protein